MRETIEEFIEEQLTRAVQIETKHKHPLGQKMAEDCFNRAIACEQLLKSGKRQGAIEIAWRYGRWVE